MARNCLVTGRNGRRAVLLETRTLVSEPAMLAFWAVLPGSKAPEEDYRVTIHRWEGRDDGKVILTVGEAFIEEIAADLETDETPISPPKGKGWRWGFGEWVRHTRKGRETRQPEIG